MVTFSLLFHVGLQKQSNLIIIRFNRIVSVSLIVDFPLSGPIPVFL